MTPFPKQYIYYLLHVSHNAWHHVSMPVHLSSPCWTRSMMHNYYDMRRFSLTFFFFQKRSLHIVLGSWVTEHLGLDISLAFALPALSNAPSTQLVCGIRYTMIHLRMHHLQVTIINNSPLLLPRNFFYTTSLWDIMTWSPTTLNWPSGVTELPF